MIGTYPGMLYNVGRFLTTNSKIDIYIYIYIYIYIEFIASVVILSHAKDLFHFFFFGSLFQNSFEKMLTLMNMWFIDTNEFSSRLLHVSSIQT